MPQRLDQQAARRAARHDNGAGLATLANALAGVDHQSTADLFSLFGGMAAVTFRHQNRTDFFLKKSKPFGGNGLRRTSA